MNKCTLKLKGAELSLEIKEGNVQIDELIAELRKSVIAIFDAPVEWTRMLPAKSGYYFAVRSSFEVMPVKVVYRETKTTDGIPDIAVYLFGSFVRPYKKVDILFWSKEPIPLPKAPTL